MAAETIYATPRVMYFRDKHNGNMEKHKVVGETSRSWLIGPSWSRFKQAKSDYEITSARDYHNQYWANEHGRKMLEQYRYGRIPYAVARAIADAIGYTEGLAELDAMTDVEQGAEKL